MKLKRFVTADTHFFHKAILTYERGEFDSVGQMNDHIIDKFNSVVGESDLTYFLGDFSFKTDVVTLKTLLNSLNGRKVLVKGNHDKEKCRKYVECGFIEATRYPIIVEKYFVLSHEPPEYYNENTPYCYLYGHVHSCELYPTITQNSACVSIERWNYMPVELDKVVEMISECRSGVVHRTYADNLRHSNL
jgi:calcineurin-like phosphoesterase family protein